MTKEKWFGQHCQYQVCQFEKDCSGVEDKSYPILVICNHEDNEDDREGNCNVGLCPVERFL